MNFKYNSFRSFRFISFSFDHKESVAQFHYALDKGPHFVENIIFHGSKRKLDEESEIALYHSLKYLFLTLGVSYFKTAVPSKIIIENALLSEEEACFFESLYLNGLGEFSYLNGLDLRNKIKFPYSSFHKSNPCKIKLPRKTIVPIGGGKDSIVTAEILKNFEEPISLFSLGNFTPINNVIEKAKVPWIKVTRELSPVLFDVNAKGALNGHVPISAIIAFTLPVCAILYGFDLAMLSNERSANIGNLIHDGFEVNHQYSKSLDFEEKISKFINNNILTNFKYFSFLRPLTELAITRLFSRFKNYQSVFTSCNKSFRYRKSQTNQLWCLDCPKCRSTFLLLAPFLEKNEILAIFGKNLLNSEKQERGYDELIGAQGNKPFECVGTDEEYIAAFYLLSNNKDWCHDKIVKRFQEAILPNIRDPQSLIKKTLTFSNEHLLPPSYAELLRATM
ncbi:MAG: hypothetical protein K8S18_09595 [Desulfobacula sp.]|nr:hypothetical protein [Desulfobacula sp.]